MFSISSPLSPKPTRSPHQSPHLCSEINVCLPFAPFGRRKGADEHTLITSKHQSAVSWIGTVSAGLKANYWIESCRARRENRLGIKGCPHRGLVVQRPKVRELLKAWGLTAWSTIPGGKHPREKGSCVPRLEFSLKKMEVGRQRESQTSNLWISPESSSGQWPLHFHSHTHLLRITESLAKAPRVGKSIILSHKTNKNKTKLYSSSCTYPSCLWLFWMMFKTMWNPCWHLSCHWT